MTYNIHGGVGCDRVRDNQRIAQIFKDENVDIALIQELETLPKLKSIEDVVAELKSEHFPHSVTATTIDTPKRWLGNAILSRHPIVATTITEIGATGRERRNILEAGIATPQGTLRAINTHFGLLRSDRRQQLEKLHTTIKSSNVPFVAAGDLNEWDPTVANLKKLNASFYSIKTGRTFPTRLPIFHLDRAWCSNEEMLLKATILKDQRTRIYSDHYPISIHLKL